jgi:hypothetical protein
MSTGKGRFKCINGVPGNLAAKRNAEDRTMFRQHSFFAFWAVNCEGQEEGTWCELMLRSYVGLGEVLGFVL